MKNITLVFIFFTSITFAQRVEPTFSWSNKADYQINGETAVTFKPGDNITIEITYTLGSTNGTNDAFNFVLAGLQDEPIANHDVINGTWANETVAQPNDYAFPGAGSGGVTTANYTIPANAPLSSENTNLTYRILTYLAYTPDGGSTTYGGPGASDPTLVYIRSQAEINALSTSRFNKNKLNAYYNAKTDAIVFKNAATITDGYTVYNIMGQAIQAGAVSNKIDVSRLKSGLYILSTASGSLKFVK